MDRLLWLVSVAFALLSMYGAACQVSNPRYRLPCWLMIVGGFILMLAVAANLDGREEDWMAAMMGCSAICVAAMWNGKRSGGFQLKHHVLRIAFCTLVVAGFIYY